MGFADRLAVAVVAPFIAVTTASARLMEQYYLQELYLVLLSRSWKSSTNPVFRGYYCFYEAGKAGYLQKSYSVLLPD